MSERVQELREQLLAFMYVAHQGEGDYANVRDTDDVNHILALVAGLFTEEQVEAFRKRDARRDWNDVVLMRRAVDTLAALRTVQPKTETP
ncbi:MAG TPA: hypothetical protein VKD22_00220 [Ramlibacter sp.]|nr:hypothetical protein [Ramlibacter sp.]